jgi:hypothetical protein
MGAVRTPIESLGLVSASDKWVFAGLSLHLKIPFLAIVETGFDDCLVGRQFEPFCLHHQSNRIFFGLGLAVCGGITGRGFRCLGPSAAGSGCGQPIKGEKSRSPWM